jgi:hypothetical protein
MQKAWKVRVACGPNDHDLSSVGDDAPESRAEKPPLEDVWLRRQHLGDGSARPAAAG